MPVKLTQSEFEDRSNKRHNSAYDYSKAIYTKSSAQVCIICKKRGHEFWQIANDHMRGSGCTKCVKEELAEKLRFTTEDFIRKSIASHPKKKYDYSRVKYTSAHAEVEIGCEEHGFFFQKAETHMLGCDCPKCGTEKAAKKRSLGTKRFIRKSLDKFAEFGYDYSKVEYKSRHKNVEIICPIDGSFFQTPANHLSSTIPCRACAYRLVSDGTRLTSEDFAVDGDRVHGVGKYDYSKVNYVASRIPVEIVCRKKNHGSFFMDRNAHIIGKHGCPTCAREEGSSEEAEVRAFIEELGFKTTSIRIDGLEFDIVVPEKSLAIEYNGVYWHSDRTGKDSSYHLNKTLLADKNGLRLIHIFSTSWYYHKDAVKSTLKHALGLTGSKVFARKCVVKPICVEEARPFMDKNHIQGFKGGSVRLGLLQGEELVAAATFSQKAFKFNKEEVANGWELTRFCTSKSVVGGLGKLLSAFSKSVPEAEYLLSYCDLTYGTGVAYSKTGFVLDGFTQPGYDWVKGGTVYSRESMQKHKLASKLEVFDPNLSEDENCRSNGMFKIYDCGNQRWIKKLH